MVEFTKADIAEQKAKDDLYISKVKDGLVSKQGELDSVKERYEYFKDSKKEDFMTLDAKRVLEKDPRFWEIERNRVLAGTYSDIVRLEGQVMAQEELYYKASKEGQDKFEGENLMFEDNARMKAELELMTPENESLKAEIIELKRQLEELGGKSKITELEKQTEMFNKIKEVLNKNEDN